MTQIWQDGFDGYANSSDFAFRYQYQQPQIGTTAGRFGGGAYQATQTNSFLAAPVAGNPDEVWIGFAFQPTLNNNVYDLLGFTSVINPECVLSYNWLTATFQLYNTATSTIITYSSTYIMSPSLWTWIDVRIKLATTAAGAIEVWCNNTQVMDVNSVQTAFNGVTGLSLIGLSGTISNTHHSQPGNYDDFVIRSLTGSANTGRVGDSRITTGVPASDAGPNNGTPSTSGPHYLMVNELQWSNANNITLVNTSGQEEAFGVTPLPVVPLTIYAVQNITFCEKTDAGDATMQQGIVSGSSPASGTTQNLVDAVSCLVTLFETDPATSAAWLPAAVDDVIITYTVTT